MTTPFVLFEGQLTTTSTLVHTVPAGREVRVTEVTLVNITGTAATARIDRVPKGGTDNTTEEIYNASIAANATVQLPLAGANDVVNLRPGDSLWVSSGTATAIDCTINGEGDGV